MKTREKSTMPHEHLPAKVEAQRRFLKVCRQRGLAKVREVEELAAKAALDLVEKGLLPNVEGLHGAEARRGAYFLSFVHQYLNPSPQVSDALAKLTHQLSASAGKRPRWVCFFRRLGCASLSSEDDLSVTFRVTNGFDPDAFLETVRQAKAEELFAQDRRAEAMQALRSA
jgi:hypothetical protein